MGMAFILCAGIAAIAQQGFAWLLLLLLLPLLRVPFARLAFILG